MIKEVVDQLGHCVKCGKRVIIDRVIEGKVKNMTTPDFDQEQFILNDNSKMRVTMCKQCRAILKTKDYTTIMKSVIAGWQKEVDELKHWTKEKKEKHMKIYKKKKIKNKTKKFKI